MSKLISRGHFCMEFPNLFYVCGSLLSELNCSIHRNISIRKLWKSVIKLKFSLEAICNLTYSCIPRLRKPYCRKWTHYVRVIAGKHKFSVFFCDHRFIHLLRLWNVAQQRNTAAAVQDWKCESAAVIFGQCEIYEAWRCRRWSSRASQMIVLCRTWLYTETYILLLLQMYRCV